MRKALFTFNCDMQNVEIAIVSLACTVTGLTTGYVKSKPCCWWKPFATKRASMYLFMDPSGFYLIPNIHSHPMATQFGGNEEQYFPNTKGACSTWQPTWRTIWSGNKGAYENLIKSTWIGTDVPRTRPNLFCRWCRLSKTLYCFVSWFSGAFSNSQSILASFLVFVAPKPIGDLHFF